MNSIGLGSQFSRNELLVTRAEVQKTELGPIVNHLANQAFAGAQVEMSELSHEMATQDLFGLRLFAYDIDINVFDSFKRLVTPELYEVVVPLLELKVRYGFGGGKLTHFDPFLAIMQEGLASGVTMPLQAALRKTHEDDPSLKFQNTTHLSFSNIAAMLRDRTMHASLLKLAHADNGTYGAASSTAGDVGSDVFRRLVKPNSLENSLFRKESYVLSKNIEEELTCFRTERSSGCPVRRTAYPTLGKHALAYAEYAGITAEELMVQERSAIVSGCEFVARALEHLVEQKSW